MPSRKLTEEQKAYLLDRITPVILWGVPNTMTVHDVRELVHQVLRQVEEFWDTNLQKEELPKCEVS
jgi:hypothetical protein